MSTEPTQLAPLTGSSKRSQVFGRISALIWPRSASDWGVLAVCARLTPKSLDTRVHKIPLCSFGHSTFTSITFYMIQRNLIQLCFKRKIFSFSFFKKMFLRKWGFLKHISPPHTTDSFEAALMCRVGETWVIVSQSVLSPLQSGLRVRLSGNFRETDWCLYTKTFGKNPQSSHCNSADTTDSFFLYYILKSFPLQWASTSPYSILYRFKLI